MKIIKVIGLLFTAAILTVACSKSDDDDVNEDNNGGNGGGSETPRREWNLFSESGLSLEFNFFGNDSRPDWQPPSPYDYESFMIYKVALPFELRLSSSPDDLLALYIGDEIRAVASPSVEKFNDEDNYTYILKILGNDDHSIRQAFTYKYYSTHFKRIFEETDIGSFMPETVMGVDEEFTLPSLYQRLDDIYPVISVYDLTLPDDIEPEKDEFIAAFVGNELRGTAKVNPTDDNLMLTVFGREEGEEATIYYFRFAHYAKLDPVIKLKNGAESILLK